MLVNALVRLHSKAETPQVQMASALDDSEPLVKDVWSQFLRVFFLIGAYSPQVESNAQLGSGLFVITISQGLRVAKED